MARRFANTTAPKATTMPPQKYQILRRIQRIAALANSAEYDIDVRRRTPASAPRRLLAVVVRLEAVEHLGLERVRKYPAAHGTRRERYSPPRKEAEGPGAPARRVGPEEHAGAFEERVR
jgi:hypothetical protein